MARSAVCTAPRHPALDAPGCDKPDLHYEGVCIRPTSASPSRPRKGIELSFIPDEPATEPPPKGSRVELTSLTEGVSLRARVEVAFAAVFGIVVEDPSQAPEWMKSMSEKSAGSARVRVSLVRDHALADDLHAMGILWLSTFLSDPSDLDAAGRVREALASRIAEEALAPGAQAAARRL